MEMLNQDQTISLKVLGFLYLRMGFPDRAMRLFQALFVLSPKDADVARSLAAAFLENGDAERALRLLEAPLLADSHDPVLLLLKARALWHLQRNEDACAVMDVYLAGNAQ